MFVDQLSQLLSNEKLRSKLDLARRSILQRCAAGYPGQSIRHDADLVLAGTLHPSASEDVFSAACHFSEEYVPVLQELVLSKLRRPHLITIADLRDTFRRVLLVRDADFDSAYSLYCGNLMHDAAGDNCSKPFPIAVEAQSDSILGGLTLDAEEAIWRNGDIAVVCDTATADIVGHEGVLSEYFRCVYARIIGEGTDAAIAEIAKMLSSALPSIVRSASLLSSAGQSIAVFDAGQLPFVISSSLDKNRAFVRWCIDFYFANPTKKDSVDRRIRNAIHLLTEADRQSSHALGLSMCCAAMEALLCRKNDEHGTVASLAERGATLLEPERQKRPNAVSVFKHLYNRRSRLLHGEDLDAAPEDSSNTRFLAAGLLKAFLERRQCMSRLPDPESPDQFFKEIDHLRLSGGEVVGVDPSPVRKLWTDKA